MTQIELFIEEHSTDTITFTPIHMENHNVGGWIIKTSEFSIIMYNDYLDLRDQVTTLRHELHHLDTLPFGNTTFGNQGDYTEERDTRRKTAEDFLPHEKVFNDLAKNSFVSIEDMCSAYSVSYEFLINTINMYKNIYADEMIALNIF